MSKWPSINPQSAQDCSVASVCSSEEEDLETRIDTWLNSRGAFRDVATSKHTSYFSAKRSKISSVLKSDCLGSQRTQGSTLKRNFDFADLVDSPPSQLVLELESPFFAKSTKVANIKTSNPIVGEVSVNGKSPRFRAGSMRMSTQSEPQGSSLFSRRLANKNQDLKLEIKELEIFTPDIEPTLLISRVSMGDF